jgi:hypothetical protein
VGRTVTPESETSHLWCRWIYLRILGVLYLAAFVSLASEVVGLVGPRGVFPAAEQLSLIARREPGVWGRLLAAPTVVWLGSNAWVLEGLCWIGVAAALLVIINRLPRVALLLCWACHLSFVTVAPHFSWYASDSLLLESTLLATFAAPAGLRPGLGVPLSAGMLFLYQWLLFRLMLETGMSKILSGDPTWRSLQAMDFFFETSPFPTWTAWFAHKLPHALHGLMTAYVLFSEIACSVLVFLGRRLRGFALAAWTLMQTGILLSGNFNTFNYHSIALAILVAGDAALGRVLRFRAVASSARDRAAVPRAWSTHVARAFLCVYFVITVMMTCEFFGFPRRAGPAPLAALVDATRAFRSANHYVLYPTIPLKRQLVVFEGSNDRGATWRPYAYRFEPQRPDARPRFIAPRYPRFDRNATLAFDTEPPTPYESFPFVFRTARGLLADEPSVVALFAANPFAGGRPDMIRTTIYRYRFTDLHTLLDTGNWWSRETIGPYTPFVVRDPVTGEARYVDSSQHP